MPTWVKDETTWDRAKTAAKKYSDKPYYYALVTHIYKNMGGEVAKGMPKEGADKEIPKVKPMGDAMQLDPYQQATEILNQNPKISAATLLNMLKAQGVKLSFPTKSEMSDTQEECDTASSNTPAVRAGVGSVNPLKKKKESSEIKFIASRLLEKDAQENGIGPTKFKAVLIQEGLGNLKDRFYYTKEALQSAIPVFEGKKIYADHPSSEEEKIRPERSVKDVLGYFENVTLEEGEDGRSLLTADVQLLDDMQYAWARGLMRHAVDYSKKFPDKDFVGLSINASGDAEEAKLGDYLKENEIPESILPKLTQAQEEGIDTIKIVSTINNAVSCDLVTEAGAGGKVLQMIEQENTMKTKEAEKKHESEEKKKENTPGADKMPPGKAMDKKQTQDDAAPPKKGDGDAAPAPHDDEVQDKALIKKLAAHMGKDGDMDEADEAMAKDALEMAHKEGYEGEEAMKCAEMGMKMMKHMASKKAKEVEESESEESEESEESIVKPQNEAKAYESLRQQYLTLKGENTKLKESLQKVELEEYLDKKLSESGIPASSTKEFREALGPIRSRKEIDKALELFKKGRESRGEALDLGSLCLGTEKVVRESNGGNTLDLSKCLR